ncbi:MAG: hypothetical protein JW776_12080 [Candidatus Lokiarchaeota archaeon]|nr:hypothetical protein [Candidatus Lokiarchaeota archaeon]
MSIRLYNPPHVLLAQGNRLGADIGGALSILAMDEDHHLHVVENLFSELTYGKFWEEPELEDEFENFIVKHQDDDAVVDYQKMISRLVNAFNKIRKKRWIFYGIAGFESNTFVEALFVKLHLKYVEKLKEAHKQIRTQRYFPTLLDNVSEYRFITSMFHGNGFQYFHYPEDLDLFSIYEKTKYLVGSVAGIVCTAESAANFYIISKNLRQIKQEIGTQLNIMTLEEALGFIGSNVIFPVSWFRIYVGRNSLESLDQWNRIQENEKLRFALKAYLHYVKTILKEEHERKKEK